jgi:hypothetical protein
MRKEKVDRVDIVNRFEYYSEAVFPLSAGWRKAGRGPSLKS